MKAPKLVALFAAASLSGTYLARPAQAFFQSTTLEGTLGTDIGGVWLMVSHVMPSFQVRLERDEKTAAPFKVGPISKDLAPAFGPDAKGVVITEFTVPSASDNYGIFKGDAITAVNATPIGDVVSFEKAVGEAKGWYLLTVRRAALKQTRARLIKIRYSASEQQSGETSGIAKEEVTVRVAEAPVPFAEEIEKARLRGEFYVPTQQQVEQLKAGWYKLPVPQSPTFVKGEHRVVAAASYDTALRDDKTLQDSLFAIVSTLQGNPMAGGGGGQNIVIFGFEKVGPATISGNYIDTTMASAPFPISIEFHGRFELTKLGAYSEKDSEYLSALAREAAIKEQQSENRSLKLAPDVPAVKPEAPKEQPAVAE